MNYTKAYVNSAAYKRICSFERRQKTEEYQIENPKNYSNRWLLIQKKVVADNEKTWENPQFKKYLKTFLFRPKMLKEAEDPNNKA